MADTEKITINMSVVDLGQIDLLVNEGFYSNRTDFIRTAIRKHLTSHEATVERAVTRKSYVLGTVIIGPKNLEKALAAGEKRSYSVIGLFVIRDNVSAELAEQVIERVSVRGIFQASDAVKKALADRME
jgi:Arc/MetJ-type ribon-helix-helix transcriptional regulator